MKPVMWIECKGNQLAGPARIGWAMVSDRGKRIDYKRRSYRTLAGHGYRANFYDTVDGRALRDNGLPQGGPQRSL